MRGELVADRVLLEGADLRLVRRADGSANWQGIGGDEPADPDAKPMELRIDGVEIEDSRVSFVDEAAPRRVEVTALDLTTDEIAAGRAVHRHRDRGRAAHGRVRRRRACRSGSRCPKRVVA